MYAVIETGGKQYRVNEGDVIFIEKLDVEENAAVAFDKVVAVSTDEGLKVGAPYVNGAVAVSYTHLSFCSSSKSSIATPVSSFVP